MKKNNLYLVSFVLSFFLITYFGLKPQKNLSLIIIFPIYLTFIFQVYFPNTTFFLKSFFKYCFYFFLSLFIVNIILNLVNVYSLDSNDNVVHFCLDHNSICDNITLIFYKFKIFRIITLPVDFFVYCLLLIGGIDKIFGREEKIRKFIKKCKKKFILLITLILIAITLTYQLVYISQRMYYLSMLSWNNRHVQFLDRFVAYEFGIEHHGWIWEYSKFVNYHTNEDSTIFIPPQNDIWPQEGNKYYFRWFVYPRSLDQSTDAYATIPDNVDYVLISRGGWMGGEAGWPKKIIKQECFVTAFLISRGDLKVSEVNYYEISDLLNQDTWGVIMLTKERSAGLCQ